jgi:hypothetical protein
VKRTGLGTLEKSRPLSMWQKLRMVSDIKRQEGELGLDGGSTARNATKPAGTKKRAPTARKPKRAYVTRLILTSRARAFKASGEDIEDGLVDEEEAVVEAEDGVARLRNAYVSLLI